jgi:hypothetical protein
MQSVQVERRKEIRAEDEKEGSAVTRENVVSGLREFIRGTNADIHDYHLSIEHTQDGLVIDFRLKADLTFNNGSSPMS